MKTLIIPNKDSHLFTTFYPNEGRETVLLLHGGPGVPDNLTQVAELLMDNFQVIGFQQRGTGLSPCQNKDYSVNSYLSDIECLADYFSLQKFHLYGHSWGGLYAQIYAQYHPERILSLFLCSPSSGTGNHWKETEKEVFMFNKSKCDFMEFLGMGWNNLLGMFGNDKAYQRLFEQVLKNYNKGFVNGETASFQLENVRAEPINLTRKELLKYPVLENNPTLNFPVTVTYGEFDIYGESKKYVKNRFPTGHIFTIQQCGHLPWLHNKRAFESIISEHYGI
ncbi:MAG: alpha/beta hydrolase [Muricauda sp.]|nr:alpha/beta hydrolase [Allomuricauda sp.]